MTRIITCRSTLRKTSRSDLHRTFGSLDTPIQYLAFTMDFARRFVMRYPSHYAAIRRALIYVFLPYFISVLSLMYRPEQDLDVCNEPTFERAGCLPLLSPTQAYLLLAVSGSISEVPQPQHHLYLPGNLLSSTLRQEIMQPPIIIPQPGNKLVKILVCRGKETNPLLKLSNPHLAGFSILSRTRTNSLLTTFPPSLERNPFSEVEIGNIPLPKQIIHHPLLPRPIPRPLQPLIIRITFYSRKRIIERLAQLETGDIICISPFIRQSCC